MTTTSTIIAAIKDIKGKHVDVTELKETIVGKYYEIKFTNNLKGDDVNESSRRS